MFVIREIVLTLSTLAPLQLLLVDSLVVIFQRLLSGFIQTFLFLFLIALLWWFIIGGRARILAY